MCGIFGMMSFSAAPFRESWLHDASRMLSHRGPDDGDLFISPDRSVALGHRRLSIIDLSANGRQPMWNENGRVAIVFNGEIYNFKELRRELSAKGHRFRSETDTEVALHGYEEYGREILERLQGMFAFALWDATSGHVLLARDRVGKKPLYVSRMPHVFLFASEIKALLRHPDVTRDLNPGAVRDYLSFGYVPAPETMFRAIHKVPAGFMMQVRRDGDVTCREYWDARIGGNEHIGFRDCVGEVKRLVEKAVEKRLVADVPIGAFLSGGVDSTIVTGLMQRMASGPVKTFSVGFDAGPSTQKVNWDAERARETARRFGTQHHEVTIGPSTDLPALIDRAIWHLDEPNANPTVISSLALSEFTRDHGLKVVLTGDGGDELFMGYSRYLYDRVLDRLRRVPPSVRKGASTFLRYPLLGATWSVRARKALHKAETLAQDAPGRYRGWRQLFSDDEQDAILSGNLRNGNPGARTGIDDRLARITGRYPASSIQEKLAYTDFKMWIPDENNMRLDKMLMAASVEGRAPLLDQELVEFALSIPSRFKQRGFQTKYVLRKAFDELLGDANRADRKRGFFSPVRWWIGSSLNGYLDTVFSEEKVRGVGIIDHRALHAIVNGAGIRRAPVKVWSLLILQRWGELYLQ
jgi:asparagine synthase (glutamine-hydrolysing)